MKKITEIAHALLIEKEAHIAVDFTCGHGFDTYFLASHFDYVYAFDIQKEALTNTKNRCEQFNHIKYILDSHANVENYVETFDVGIFNCGYLPHGEKTITTNSNEVLASINKCLSLLSEKGRIVVVLYPGFLEGKKEAEEVEKYLTSLNGKKYDVFKIQVLNRENVPYIIGIDKH